MHACRTEELRRKQICHGRPCHTHISTESLKQLVGFVCLNHLLMSQVKAKVVEHIVSVIHDGVKVWSRFAVAWWCTFT